MDDVESKTEKETNRMEVVSIQGAQFLFRPEPLQRKISKSQNDLCSENYKQYIFTCTL